MLFRSDSVIHSRQGTRPPRSTPQLRPREQPGSALPPCDPSTGRPKCSSLRAVLGAAGGDAPGTCVISQTRETEMLPDTTANPRRSRKQTLRPHAGSWRWSQLPGRPSLRSVGRGSLSTRTQRLTQPGARWLPPGGFHTHRSCASPPDAQRRAALQGPQTPQSPPPFHLWRHLGQK